MVDPRLVHRASVLREWMGTESYAIVQDILKEMHEDRLHKLLINNKDFHDRYVGEMGGLIAAANICQQVMLDEDRQRPREVTTHKGA